MATDAKRSIGFYALSVYFMFVSAATLPLFFRHAGIPSIIFALVIFSWALITLFALIFSVGKPVLIVAFVLNGAMIAMSSAFVFVSIENYFSGNQNPIHMKNAGSVIFVFLLPMLFAIRRLWQKYNAQDPANVKEE